uniref:Reverse transcriptase domain-containing protein n=1 Tax=Xiphophorus maculatus TaxID=8083 RepID=A0A3B5Q121_XIPMA
MVKDFLNLIDSFNFTQWVFEPTHEGGHVLDLVLSFGLSISHLMVGDAVFSDHKPVLFNIDMPSNFVKPCVSTRCHRVISQQTAIRFSELFESKIPMPSFNDTETLTAWLYSTCQSALDEVAPMKPRKWRTKMEPWLNDRTRAARRECRKFERKWKKDNLQVSFQVLKDSWHRHQLIVKDTKREHLSNIILLNRHKPRLLFHIVDSVLNVPHYTGFEPSLEVCEKFRVFFEDKVAGVRANIMCSASDPSVAVKCSTALSQFEPVTLSLIHETVGHLKASGSAADILPPRLFKEVLPVLGISITAIINSSLITGVVPKPFKQASLQPLIKKPGLDPFLLSNFRPISKLPFMSKILEKVVYNQLKAYLDVHNILEDFQSGFKTLHSTESALLRVFNDILLATDAGDPVILVLLDLTAAFDTVDHDVLLSRLEHYVGLKGTVLVWLRSYLTDRSFCVDIDDFRSSSAPLLCGVPQGSILGPLLFSLYLLPLGSIFRKHNIAFHCYADDTQIYVPLNRKGVNTVPILLECLDDIKTWMALNFLNFNERKTEVIIFDPGTTCKSTPVDLGPLSHYVKPFVTNLGFVMDSNFKLDKQISAVVKTSFFHLRRLAKIRNIVPVDHFEILIHAFITTRLDYCNSLYVGVSQSSLSRLQLVQNAAARLLTGSRKREHVTPILYSLHWLPVHFRVHFKILLFVFKSLNGLAPSYLSELLHIHCPP